MIRLLIALALVVTCSVHSIAAAAQNTRIEIDLGQVLDQARAEFRRGNLEEAIALYQLIVRFAPESRTARIELSFALAAYGDRERASRLLRDLDTRGLDPDVIAAIGQLVGPDRFSLFMIPEIFLDTNVNGQTKSETIDTIFGPLTLNNGRGREGFGYGLTVGGVYRLSDAAPSATLTTGARIRDFERTQDDEASLFSSVSFGIDLGRLDLLPSVSGAYRFRDGDRYEAELGLGLAVALDFQPVRNTLGGRMQHVEGQGNFDGVLDRDTYEIYDFVSVGWSSLALRVEGRYFREDWTVTQSQDNSGFVSGVDTILVNMPWMTPTIGGSFTYRDFKNPAPLFGVERLDREYEGHLELLFREIDLFGSNLFIRYEYTDVSSNIGLFDYDRHEFSVGVRAISW